MTILIAKWRVSKSDFRKERKNKGKRKGTFRSAEAGLGNGKLGFFSFSLKEDANIYSSDMTLHLEDAVATLHSLHTKILGRDLFWDAEYLSARHKTYPPCQQIVHGD